MKSIEKKGKIYKLLAFLLGFFCCNNIIYGLKIGNTYINIVLLYGFFLLIGMFFFQKKKLFTSFKEISKYYKLFLLIVGLSLINVILFVGSNYLNIFFNGIIAIILDTILFVVIVAFKDHKDFILKGLYFGMILNIFISLIQFIAFKSGITISLFEYFPQPAFQVSTFWANNPYLGNDYARAIYRFRAQGLFLETSYFLGFLIATSLVLIKTRKKTLLNILLLILGIIVVLLTESGNIIILLICIVLYWLLKKKENSNSKKVKNTVRKKTLLQIFVIFILAFVFIISQFNRIQSFFVENDIKESVSSSFKSANLSDEDNEERFTNMMNTVKLYPTYSLGAGYNMSSTVLEKHYTLRVYSSFNFIIKLLIETSIIGVIVYLCFIYQLSIKLVQKRDNDYVLALGISVLGILACQFANGIPFYPFVILIFALATIEYNRIKSGSEKK